MSQADISSAYTFQIQSTIDQLEHQLLTIKDESNKLAILIQKTRDASLLTEKELSEIKANMDMLSVYNNKLLSIKATMSMLSGRSKQLLSRAEKLKQIKMEYLLQIDEIKQQTNDTQDSEKEKEGKASFVGRRTFIRLETQT
ncbi:hypothetical protein BCV72DRAFT_337680 [Rhizopus microsporus var. microsporus]|uniref:Uncharacterized protein n=1 Tax=Rhizopus microsporus var. microsporus TaxID=86635 RepID=A0A1X0QVU5_RHIZD|nr:hypothetical protein BCV72DRAFT_337680 [Rhizopus microsporus var. microsporus]